MTIYHFFKNTKLTHFIQDNSLNTIRNMIENFGASIQSCCPSQGVSNMIWLVSHKTHHRINL